MKNQAILSKLATCAFVTCALLSTAAAVEAQVTIYPGKVVCGFEQGNVPLLNDPNPLTPPKPYENFKPGNYATVFNVLNLNAVPQSVSFVLTFQNLAPVNLITLVVNPFSSVEIGCEEIFNPFIPPLTGQRLEGMLVVVPSIGPLDVKAVYSYASQNAFERHVIYQEGEPMWSFGKTLYDILYGFEPPPGFFVQAASGAGGLGLGASIDVENIDPVTIGSNILDIAVDTFPIEELAGEEPAGGKPAGDG